MATNMAQKTVLIKKYPLYYMATYFSQKTAYIKY